MNSFLLSLGIAVALALIAAFAAPFFIDWSSYRTYFEARASEMLGRPVSMDGELTVRLVPFPSLVADSVRIGGPESNEGAARVEVKAALTPLLSGQIAISEVVLTHPYAVLRLDRGGRISWAQDDRPQTSLGPERIAIDRFQITDGAFEIADERTARTYRLAEVNLEGSAGSLVGPFKAEGGAVFDERRFTVRLNTGRMQAPDEGMRVKLSLMPADRPLAIELDGTFARADEVPSYAGAVTITRLPVDGDNSTWRLEAMASATPEAVVLDNLGVRLGPEGHAVTLSGAASIDLGRVPTFDAVLSARQIDFDRLFGSGPDAPVSAQEAVERLSELLMPEAFPVRGHLALDVESMVVAQGLIEGVSLDLDVDGARWTVDQMSATVPGRTNFGLSGSIDLDGPSPAFDASIRIGTEQAALFAEWLVGPQRRGAGTGVVLPSGHLEGSGRLRIDADGVVVDDLEIESGDSLLAGSFLYRPPRDMARGSVRLALTAERFTVPPLPGIGTGEGDRMLGGFDALLGELDLDVELKAGELSHGELSMRDVDLSAVVSGGDLRIERLSIGDIGGATIQGGGQVREFARTPDGELTLNVTAQSFDGIVEVLRTLGYADAAATLEGRSDLLVPARLNLRINAARTVSTSRAHLSVAGLTGGTVLRLAVGFEGQLDTIGASVLDITFNASGGEGHRLARQLGLDPGDGPDQGGRVLLTASGRPDTAVRFELAAAGIGLGGNAKGQARWRPASGGELTADIAFDIARPDAMLRTLGVLLPEQDLGPVHVDGSLAVDQTGWRLSNLRANSGDAVTRGRLSLTANGPDQVIDGALDADRVDLRWLLSVFLGPGVLDMPDAGVGDAAWPSVGIVPPRAGKWRGRIAVSTPAATLFDGATVNGARFGLGFDAGKLSVDGLKGEMFGGRFSGDLDLAFVDDTLAVSGQLDLADARLEEIVWSEGGRSVATGSVTAGLDFEGRGRSALAIVSSLSGTGSFRATDGVVRRINPRAFDHIVSAADAGMELTEERVRDVFAGHLDSGSLEFQAIEGAFSISSGVLRATNVHIDSAALASFASAIVDLTQLAIDSEWTLKVGSGEEGRGAREVGVVFAGPLAAPQRQIDVNPLLGYLTVRAFEGEVERLEALQLDILERERLGRQLIRRGQERVRRERMRAEEDARLQADEELRRLFEETERARGEEAARQRAEEEARRAAEEQARQDDERRRASEEEAQRQAEEEARRKAEEDARLLAEEAARLRAEAEARRQAEEDARRQAGEEDRQRAADEARRVAEEEARRQAEEEARRVAEEQARRLAEEEARRQAEEAEARRIAEEEARRIAEEEARRAAEEEARRLAEEEERRRAEEEVRQRAEQPDAGQPDAGQAATEQPQAEPQQAAQPPAESPPPESPPAASQQAAPQDGQPATRAVRQILPAPSWAVGVTGSPDSTAGVDSGTPDDGDFEQRIQDVLSVIPPTATSPVPSAGVMAPAPGQAVFPIVGAPAEPGTEAPPIGAPIEITPSVGEPIALTPSGAEPLAIVPAPVETQQPQEPQRAPAPVVPTSRATRAQSDNDAQTRTFR